MRHTSGMEAIPFSIPVYVSEATLAEGYHPRAGDQVKGALWLQGCPEGLRFPLLYELWILPLAWVQ